MKPILDSIQNIQGSDTVRIFHGRGGVYPGLNDICIDYYSPYVLITLFKEFDEQMLSEVVSAISDIDDVAGIGVQKRYIFKAPMDVVYGEMPEKFIALENGLKYHVRFGQNQNIGLFLDMSEGRKLVKEIAKDKRVLNLFSYTCSLSVCAVAGGATNSVNVDMSRGALNTGRENHLLNELPTRGVSFIGHDIFRSFGKLKRFGPYDLIIIDPPSNQGKSFNFRKDYERLIRRVPELLAEGGEVVACLNSPFEKSDFLISKFEKYVPELKVNKILYSPDSFEELDKESGVKIVYLTPAHS